MAKGFLRINEIFVLVLMRLLLVPVLFPLIHNETVADMFDSCMTIADKFMESKNKRHRRGIHSSN